MPESPALEARQDSLLKQVAGLPSGQMGLLNVADVVGPLAHELHNILNNIVLKAAVLSRQVQVDESLREQVNGFRALAVSASKLWGQLDRYRHELTFPQEPVDVGNLIREVVRQCQSDGTAIECHVDSPLPPAWGNPWDIYRLGSLLIAAARAAGPPIQVRVTADDRRLLVIVEDSGPDVAAEALERLFEPWAVERGGSGLERAACQSIVRRLDGKLRAQRRPEGGLTVSAELKSAQN